MAEPNGLANHDDLRVEGGAGGIAAHLEDLATAGAVLRSVAAQLADHGRGALAVAAAPGLQVTALASPITYARFEVALGRATLGSDGLLTLAARTEALGVSAGVAADAYRTADVAAAQGLSAAEFFVGRSLGAMVGTAAIAVSPEVLTVAAVGVIAVKAGAVSPDSGRALLGPLRRIGSLTLTFLADHAQVTGAVLPILPGTVGGVVSVLPGGPAIAPALFGRVGGPFTPTDFVIGLEKADALAGRFMGNGPRLSDPGPVSVRAHPVPVGSPAADLAELTRRIPSTDTTEPLIHVERVEAADGSRRWVVSIPGTANWSPVPGRTPFDLTGNLRLMAGERSSGMAGLVAAMREVGVAKGEPVLLIGHSQGGLIAAAAAADPVVRHDFTVTQVIATGAPIASIPIPDDVQVLTIEHTDDLVPQLDGAPNRDRPNWVTISAAAPRPDQVPGQPSRPSEPLRAHNLELYQQTAARVDRSADPSITAWREGLMPFLASSSTAPSAAWNIEISRAS